MRAKILFLIEDIEQEELDNIADDMRSRYSRSAEMDDIVVITEIDQYDEDFEGWKDMRYAMGYGRRNENDI